MRNPDRIDRILGLISKLWHLFPDLRLGQLLYNFAGFGDENYHIDDDTTEKVLINHLGKFKPPNK